MQFQSCFSNTENDPAARRHDTGDEPGGAAESFASATAASLVSVGAVIAMPLAALRAQAETRVLSLNRPSLHFHSVISTTPPTIIAAARTIRKVTLSTSRKNSALKISEKNGPVLLIGMTTDTLPKSSA